MQAEFGKRFILRLRELERENGELKKLMADLGLDRKALKEAIRKNGWGL